MAQYAQLPDKSYVEFPDDWTEEQMDAAVYRDFADQFPDRAPEEPGIIDKVGSALKTEVLPFAESTTTDIVESLGNIVNPPEAADVVDPDTFLSATGKHAQNIPAVGKMTLGGLMEAQAEPLPGVTGAIAEGQGMSKLDALGAFVNMLMTGEGQALMTEPFLGKDLQKARDVVAGTGEVIAKEGAAEYAANQPEGLTGAAKLGSDTTRAILEMAPAYTLAFLTKNPKMVPAVMGAQVKGRSFQESKEKGLADYEASARSNFNVFAEGLPEYIPALAILKKGGAASKIGWGALGEGAQEMVTEVLQDVYDARELEGLSLKDAISGIDWGKVLYSGAVGVGAGGATGAVVSAADAAGAKLDERKQDKAHEAKVDEALTNIEDYQAQQALSPDKGIDPKRTTQQPEDVGPAASGATAQKEELAQAQEAYTKAEAAEAAEDLGGRASGAQQLTEQEARDEEARILAEREQPAIQKRVQEEADAAYEQRQDDLEKQKQEDAVEARVQQAKQDTRVQTRAAEEERQQKADIEEANKPADAQPKTMEQEFQKVLDEELISELKKTLPQQKKLEHRPTIHLPGKKAPEPKPVKLTHFSKKAGLAEIDPAMHGAGIRGQESKRKQQDPANWVDRSYFYLGDEVQPDVMLGKEKYEIEFDENKLYDYRNDPEGLRPGATTNKILNISAYEKSIKEAGYAGYRIDTEEQGNVVAMFEKTPAAARVETNRPGGATAEFFTKMTLGEGGIPEATYQPVLKPVEKKSEFVNEYNKHRGNFDDHIRASIPGFGEVQVFVGDAILDTYDTADVLDIGASEGSWAKTISANSDGHIKTTSLDPLKAMADFFNQEEVKGAEFRMEAFGDEGWTEPDGTVIKPFVPEKQYDVVHEAMTFQFIDNARGEHIARAKSMLKPDGILLTEEKLKDDGTPEYQANEAKKDEYKSQYFTPEAIADKAKETLVVGMNDNMVTREHLELVLKDQFENVAEYWDAGNFAGYAASDDAQKLEAFLDNLAPTHSEYSRQGRYGPARKPRWLKGEPVPAVFKRQSPADVDPDFVSTAPAVDEEAFTTEPKGDKGFGTLAANPLPQMAKVWEDTAQKGIDVWNDAVGWRYDTLGKLPSKELYLVERYKVLGRIADVDKIAKDVYSTFRNASQEDQRAVYDYLTTPDATPNIIDEAAVRRKAVATKRLINQTGQALVDKGLLAEEAFLKNKDGYLPRTYLKYLIGEDTVRQITGGKKVSKMAWSKARKEIPAEVRELILGEITDPAYLASKGLGTELRDIAIIDFLDFISQKEQWVHEDTTVTWEGRTVSVIWLDQEAKRLERQAAYYTEDARQRTLAIVSDMKALLEDAAVGEAPVDSKDYRQVPINKRYGRLQGMYVRKEIYDDLLSTGQIMPGDADFWENWFGYGGAGTKVTQLWKMSKVALNPPAQIRNAASNMILLHLSGMPLASVPVYITKAIKDIRANGRYWKLAKKHGVTESTFAAQELFRIERDLLDLESRLSGPLSIATMKNMAGIIGEYAGDAYQLIEAMGKTARIMYGMEKEGLNADDAAMKAQKWLFDYSLVPAPVRTARNMPLGVPFITFYYKVLPRLLETAVKRPWAYAPYVALPSVMAMLFAEVNDVDDEDAKQLMKAYPMWLQEKGNAFLYPYKDEAGRWQAIDFGYILPWSMFTESGRKASEGDFADAIKSSGIFGGPIPSLATAIKTNTDPYTGREIVPAEANPKDQVMGMLTYTYNLAMPTWTTSQGFAGKMLDAINEDIETNEEMGRTVLTPGQATLRMFGANVYPFNPERARGKNIERWQMKMTDIKTNARRKILDLVNDRGDNEVEIQAVQADTEARLQKIAEKIETYAEGSEVPEALTLD